MHQINTLILLVLLPKIEKEVHTQKFYNISEMFIYAAAQIFITLGTLRNELNVQYLLRVSKPNGIFRFVEIHKNMFRNTLKQHVNIF